MIGYRGLSQEEKTNFTADVVYATERQLTAREARRELAGKWPDVNVTIDMLRSHAANLDVRFRRPQRDETDEELFDSPRRFEKLEIDSLPDGYRVMIVNDTQIPFQDDETLEAVERFWTKFQPNLEVYNGDIIDFYSISDFDKNPTRKFNLQAEIDMATRWMARRANANPKARRVFIEGNHEDRLRRFLWRAGKDVASLRALQFEQLMRLEELGFEDIPYNGILDLLGYQIQHGFKCSDSKAYPTNVSRWMAIATASSGLVGHTHKANLYGWTDSRGSHSFIENGCLCRSDLEYAPFPNWQQAFTYGYVYNNKVHLNLVRIYPDGFVAEGEFYARGK